MAELESFALENEKSEATQTGNVSVPANYSQILLPDSIISGGKTEFSGVGGKFARILVGDAEEIRFVRPVAVGGINDLLFIVDAGARVVFKYNLTTKTIKPIGNVGVQFIGEPGNIYVAKDASFYIVDGTGKQVFHFSEKGELLTTFSDPANLSRPIDVLVDESTGEVLVADGSFSHIVVFDQFGKSLRIIGRRGTGPGRFRAITSMTMGSDGLYVVDRLELSVQVISTDGLFRYSFGENNQVFPTSVAVTNEQLVFVGDKSDNTIRVYQNGILLAEVGTGGSGPGRFRLITGLWTNNEFLYVADSMNRRVQVLRIVGGTSETKL